MPESPAPRAHLLHRSVEPPVRHHPWLAVGVGLLVAGFAATGAALPMLLIFSGPDMTAYEGTWHDEGGATNMSPLRSDVALAPAPEPAIHLVEVLDGTSYLMIAPLPRAPDAPAVLPPGADAPRLIGSTAEPRGAVATLETPPGAGAGWLGREVVLDNGCRARVTDLAIVAVMTGGTDYMAVEPRSPATDVAAALMRDGAPQVAAVLDGCAGAYAYPADQAAPIVPTRVTDDELFAAARRRAFDSAPARAANAAWREAGHSGTWQGHEYTEVETRAYRHPRTGATTVSVMANSDVGCGGANIQLWAIYEIDAGGAWHERVVTASSPLYTIEEALDLDGDGILEWLGSAQLGDRLVVGVAGGEPVTKAQLEIPFFGCPC